VGGFAENYVVWTYHGEKAPPPIENTLDEMIEDVEFIDCLMLMMNFVRMSGMIMVMVSARGPSIVVVMTVVTMNLMMVISLANCCATPKLSYW
jgi:hypothetical protein